MIGYRSLHVQGRNGENGIDVVSQPTPAVVPPVSPMEDSPGDIVTGQSLGKGLEIADVDVEAAKLTTQVEDRPFGTPAGRIVAVRVHQEHPQALGSVTE
jgi:hypothetical protein